MYHYYVQLKEFTIKKYIYIYLCLVWSNVENKSSWLIFEGVIINRRKVCETHDGQKK